MSVVYVTTPKISVVCRTFVGERKVIAESDRHGAEIKQGFEVPEPSKPPELDLEHSYF